MQKSEDMKPKRSLRSVNNCYQIPNIFKSMNQKVLTSNLELIPKHILLKIGDKKKIICRDILDLYFESQRWHTDLQTVKSAVFGQRKYTKTIERPSKHQNSSYKQESQIQKLRQEQHLNKKSNIMYIQQQLNTQKAEDDQKNLPLTLKYIQNSSKKQIQALIQQSSKEFQ